MSGTTGSDVGRRLCTVLALVLLWGCVEVSGSTDSIGVDMSGRSNLYNIHNNCSSVTPADVPGQQPCRRVCHPEDCFLLTPGQLNQLNNNSSRLEILGFQLECIAKVSKRSYRVGCHDKERVNNVTEHFIEQFVQQYDNNPSPLSKQLYDLQTAGSSVLFPTMLYHKKFSICSKFTLTRELNSSYPTSFLSFSTSDIELFRISLYSEGRVVLQTVNSGAALFQSTTPLVFSVGSASSLCVSFKVQPAIQTAVWIRTEGGLLTRLSPVAQTPLYHLAAWNSTTVLGVVSIGESPMRLLKGYPSFVGEVQSLRVFGRFLKTKRQVLKFIRCEENPLDMLKSVVAGAVAMATKDNKTMTHEVTMATQQNEPLWIRRIVGSVQVRDETEEDRKRYCGDPCITG